MMVAGTLDSNFAPGEYHLWLDFKTDRTYNNVHLKEWGIMGSSFEIYPNPVSVASVLTWSGEISDELSIKIYGTDGKMLAMKNFQRGESLGGSIAIGEFLHSLDKGVYLLEILSSGVSTALQFAVP
jgi:hypothetical protein